MNLFGFELPDWFGKRAMADPYPFVFTPTLPVEQARELIGRVRGGDFHSHRTIKLAFGIGGCVNELRGARPQSNEPAAALDDDALLTQVEQGLAELPTEEGAAFDVPDWLVDSLLTIVRRVLCQGV